MAHRNQQATGYRPWQTQTRSDVRANADKVSKLQADYTPQGTMTEHCSICEFFIPAKSNRHNAHCEKVASQNGISPKGWCKFWSKR